MISIFERLSFQGIDWPVIQKGTYSKKNLKNQDFWERDNSFLRELDEDENWMFLKNKYKYRLNLPYIPVEFNILHICR